MYERAGVVKVKVVNEHLDERIGEKREVKGSRVFVLLAHHGLPDS